LQNSKRAKPFEALYVHVPFCKSKCPYCDFYSGIPPKKLQEYSKAVVTELSTLGPDLCPFPTVYFGGGTPSLMPVSFFEAVLSRVGQFSEVTVEFNPEEAESEKLAALKSLGVNRVSLGIQSFNEKTLKNLGRRSSPVENLKAVEEAAKVFPSVSVDLMYGVPHQGVEEFLKDLESVLKLPVQHVSLYALTLYEGTPLHGKFKRGELELPDEETVRMCYNRAVELLTDAGFVHYEVSNFAKPGFECKHNLHYWKLNNYLGLGPSAASFFEGTFRRNAPNLRSYLERALKGEPPEGEEERFEGLELQKLKLTVGLRLTEGVELNRDYLEKLKSSPLFKGIEGEFVEVAGNRLKLTPKAYFVSNAVIAKVIEALQSG